MFRNLFLLFLALFVVEAFAQTADTRYFIAFTDKNNTPFAVSNPAQFLSPRAISRRIDQGIAITTTDLPVNPAYVDSLISKGATIHGVSKWLNGVVVNVSSAAQLAAIAALPFVKSNTLVKARLHGKSLSHKFEYSTVPAEIPSQETLYGASYTQINMLNGLFLHEAGYKGGSKLIAVLDVGFSNVDSNNLLANTLANHHILYTADIVDNQTSVYEDPQHGAMVLSTMAANNPYKYIGTAPEADYILLRSEDEHSETLVEEYYWAIAAEKADSFGADLINSSLGYNEFDNNLANHTYADLNGTTTPAAIAANLAQERGILVVVSAGNEGDHPWKRIGTPADAIGIITVGAVQSDRSPAVFTSYGPSSDGRVKPDLASMGALAAVIDNNGYIVKSNGTSFASPILCGMAACLWQKHPLRTAAEVRSALIASAHLYHFPDNREGYGIPDFRIADIILNNPENPLLNQTHPPAILGNPYGEQSSILAYSVSAQTGNYKVYSVTGQLLFEKEFSTSKETYTLISLSDLNFLSTGNYIIAVTINDSLHYLKLMK